MNGTVADLSFLYIEKFYFAFIALFCCKDKIGGACSTYGRYERCIQGFGGET